MDLSSPDLYHPVASFEREKKKRKKSTLLTRDCHLQSSCGSHVDAALPPPQRHAANWPAGMPGMTPMNSLRAALTHPSGSDSAVSALLTHGAAHSGAALLIPKTEKLSPVQLYSTDRSSLAGTTLMRAEPFASCRSDRVFAGTAVKPGNAITELCSCGQTL